LLDRFIDREKERELGAVGFGILGPEAISAEQDLVRLTRHPDKQVRRLALESLGSINAESQVFLPVLLQMIHDPSGRVRWTAVGYLSRLFPAEAEKAEIYKTFPEFRPFQTTNSSVQNK
jgi:hypothetical protein